MYLQLTYLAGTPFTFCLPTLTRSLATREYAGERASVESRGVAGWGRDDGLTHLRHSVPQAGDPTQKSSPHSDNFWWDG
ncbi:hypothetical protein E2C01_038160 [Portunus trituberculatus]|uniref:Uncharacterized protein n=1 Tax=Portunus trituberculatus TaxID=210409 RepID=A0A5B7FG36_PORTR|nr:hypothetical protein [Portunus trituberculatus]